MFYQVEPTMWTQWKYIEGINADIRNSEIHPMFNKGLAQDIESMWEQVAGVHETFKIWKQVYWDVKLRRPALGVAAKKYAVRIQTNKVYRKRSTFIAQSPDSGK